MAEPKFGAESGGTENEAEALDSAPVVTIAHDRESAASVASLPSS